MSLRRSLHCLQETAELQASESSVDFCNDRTGLNVRRCEEVGRPGVDAVVCMTLRLTRADGEGTAFFGCRGTEASGLSTAQWPV